MKRFTVLLLWLFLGMPWFPLHGQQDPMTVKWSLEPDVYNPAYGAKVLHNTVRVQERSQVDGYQEGRRLWQAGIHLPILPGTSAAGIWVNGDRQGPTSSFSFQAEFARQQPLQNGGTLYWGVRGGIQHWKANLEGYWPGTGTAGPGEYQGTQAVAGAGIVYQFKWYELGLSCPQFFEFETFPDSISSAAFKKQYRHYYWSFKGNIPLGKSAWTLHPLFLLRTVGLISSLRNDQNYAALGSPIEWTMDAGVAYRDRVGVGAAYRSTLRAAPGKSPYDLWDVYAWYDWPGLGKLGVVYYQPRIPAMSGTKLPWQLEFQIKYTFDRLVSQVVSPRQNY